MWTGRTDNRRTLGTSIRLTSLFVLDAIFCHFNILKCSFMFFSVYLVDLLMIHLIHALDEFCLSYLTLFRPPQFQDWPIEAWKNLSNPQWREETDPSSKSCRIKNYDYDKVRNNVAGAQ